MGLEIERHDGTKTEKGDNGMEMAPDAIHMETAPDAIDLLLSLAQPVGR
jgi:hypothetical protein